MKKIVFISVGNINVASARIRCYQLAQQLRRIGWDCRVGERHLGDQDFVVFQKRYFGMDLETAKHCKGKIILDMCDPYWLKGHQDHIKNFIGKVDCVVASTDKIAEWFRQRNKKTVVIPDGFDFDEIPDVQKTDKLTIIWHGSRGNTRYLEILVEPLDRLSREFDFDFRIVVDRPYIVPRFSFAPQVIEWRRDTYLSEIAECHIGVAPLAGDEWCSYKTANKPVSYMALGLPVVCSSIPSYDKIIRNGFVIKNNDPRDWYQALKTLIVDKEKRLLLIAEGRKIAQDFSMVRMAKKWDELLKKVEQKNAG